MHHFPSAVPPIRTANASPYGYGAPAQTAPRIAGHVAYATTSLPVAHAVAPAHPPVQQQQQPAAPSKMQPQLQNLPRFQPPSFENANGLLPCPDSPGSTPRGDEETEEDSRDNAYGISDHGGSLHGKVPIEVENIPEAVVPSRQSVEPSAQEPEVMEQKKEKEHESRSPFPIGAFVEYKSRSSGHWITAKVEAYDENSKIYKLDVQPHAHHDRVRARQPAGAGGDSRRERENNTVRDSGHDRDRGRDRNSVREAEAAADRHESSAGREHETVRDRDTGRELSTAAVAYPEAGQEIMTQNNLETLGQVTVAPVTVSYPSYPMDTVQVQQPADEFYNCGPERIGELSMEMNEANLASEVERLRQQVAQLQADKADLQDALRQEKSLKDRYFSELCICHEQIQRARGTPR